MAVIVCDKCGHEQGFSPHLSRMKDGIERNYIVCEKCKEQHTAFYTDKTIRELQARQRKIARRIGGRRADEYQKLYDEYESNKDRITIMMFELRQRIEKE